MNEEQIQQMYEFDLGVFHGNRSYAEHDDLRHDHGIHVNDKRVLRICRARDIRSTVKYNNRGCTMQARKLQYLAENLLDRQCYAAKPNGKWFADVTEFKWYEGTEISQTLSERHSGFLRPAHRVLCDQ